MNPLELRQFQATVWDYYHDHGRDLPWRHEPFDPYRILVSEIMLQQTQVPRVIPKYEAFLKQFPTLKSLAVAPLADVLIAWSGLGYNRRAKYLHEASKQLAILTNPWTLEDLTVCKGIGTNTAAAIITYAYNQPLVFVETNIRTVFIHHFLANAELIDDRELLPLVKATLDHEHPREWYWALMDYGSYLKTTVGNAARSSRHYFKQSAFAGSKRQIRGQVLRLLGTGKRTLNELRSAIPDERLNDVLAELVREGLIQQRVDFYLLAS
jgi:A/G-specific adenine glycosylase